MKFDKKGIFKIREIVVNWILKNEKGDNKTISANNFQ